jgi:hypothetical protein
MRAVLPVHVPLIDEPHERFVNEGRGLERVVCPLASHVLPGHTAQLRVQDGHKPFRSLGIVRTQLTQDLRHVVSRHRGLQVWAGLGQLWEGYDWCE